MRHTDITEESGDPGEEADFDAGALFDVVENEENSTHVLEAMRRFLKRGDTALFERAVAVYVRSSRARGAPIEAVLGALQSLADELERDAPPGFEQRDTPMRHLVLRGVLLAFYGSDAVQRETTARELRVERRMRSRGDDKPGAPDA